jgi:tRNA A37 threonylcarbamoyladenosine dehydratase
VLDCMDNVTAKIDVITTARARGVRCLSSMGAANKFDPTRIQATDISETKVDPLARVVRYELRKRGISTGVTVVWSDETPVVPTQPEPSNEGNDHPRRRQIPGSTAFVPPAAGLLLASLVVRYLLGRCGNR